MEPIVLTLSAALVLSVIAIAIFVVLWMGERKAHRAAKELLEAERRTRSIEEVMEHVQPLWDQVNT